MRIALTTLLALAGLPALAADLPPPPPPGAPLEERLFLATALPDTAPEGLGLLAARIDCVAYQRALIDARLREGLLSRGWNADSDRLWRLSEALARFEADHIRTMIDAETQAAVLVAYASASRDDDARARRCLAFGDRFALGRASG